jgi:hypothetical protein
VFCRRFRCRDAQFEKAVLRRCFPPLSRPLGTVVLALNPGAFKRELALIRRLGGVVNESPLRGELDGYAYENQRDKSARTETFGLRLSRRRFLRIWRDTFAGQSSSAIESSTTARSTRS